MSFKGCWGDVSEVWGEVHPKLMPIGETLIACDIMNKGGKCEGLRAIVVWTHGAWSAT